MTKKYIKMRYIFYKMTDIYTQLTRVNSIYMCVLTVNCCVF